jgi:hypothetical protein
VSEHQQAGTSEFDGEMAPAEDPREAKDSESDLEEPDFSRLRMARASLDAAFPQE